MAFDAQQWMTTLTGKLKDTFGTRLLFVGLQGSYRRNEAKPTSDVDAVVILDELAIGDLKKYREIIAAMPDKEKACGFISGRREINNWPKPDIFQFANDTAPFFGSLDGLVPEVERKDIEAYVQTNCANLYHFVVHSYLYDKNTDNLKMLPKTLFFLFQAVNFLRTGKYVPSRKELCAQLTPEERDMLCRDVDSIPASELEKVYEGMIRYFSKGFCP